MSRGGDKGKGLGRPSKASAASATRRAVSHRWRVIYRVLFAPQGKRKQVFLSLEALKKKTQKTSPEAIRLAKRRLRDWQQRGD